MDTKVFRQDLNVTSTGFKTLAPQFSDQSDSGSGHTGSLSPVFFPSTMRRMGRSESDIALIDIDLGICLASQDPENISIHRLGIDMAVWAEASLEYHDTILSQKMESLHQDIDLLYALKKIFRGVAYLAPSNKKTFLVFEGCHAFSACLGVNESDATFEKLMAWQSNTPSVQNISACFTGWQLPSAKSFFTHPNEVIGLEFNEKNLMACRGIIGDNLVSDAALQNVFQQTQGHSALTMDVLREMSRTTVTEGTLDDVRAAEITQKIIDSLRTRPVHPDGEISIWDHFMEDYQPPACYLPQDGAAALREGPLSGRKTKAKTLSFPAK